MKKFLMLFTILLLLIPIISVNSYDSRIGERRQLRYEFQMSLDKIAEEKELINKDKIIDSLKFYLSSKGIDYSKYKYILGNSESKLNYKATNRFGYMGMYQFGSKTIRSLIDKGFLRYDTAFLRKDLFLSSPTHQEEALAALTSHNEVVLSNYGLDKYKDKTINGVKVTLEGMLAASHLRGPYSVKLFLESNGRINKTDGNGTSVRDYMFLMSG